MAVIINVIGSYFVALGASYEQSQFLGSLGLWYSGPRSIGSHAKALHALGVKDHVRFLPVTDMVTVAKLVGVEGVTFTPSALQLVSGVEETIAKSRDSQGSFEIPTPKGLTYRPYQKAGVGMVVDNVINNLPGTLIADEMGLGKTMQAIGAIAHLNPVSCLVLCLTSIKTNWERELTKWLPFPTKISIATEASEVLESGITIVSYPSLVGSSTRAKNLLSKLKNHSWPMVVCDEAHVLKNTESQTAKAVLGHFKRGILNTPGILQNSGHTVILTGTPIQNKVRESLPILRAVGLIGTKGSMGTEVNYLYRYCGPQKVSIGRGKIATTFDGATNLAELQDKLRASGAFIRRLKVDVAKELPPKVRSIIRFDNPGVDDLNLPVGEGMEFDAIMGLASRTHSFESLAKYRANLATAKIPMVVEHLNDMLEGSSVGKVIVFAHHQTMVNALQEAFPMSIRIDGSTPADKRQDLVDSFQADPAIRVAILSTRAAGTGLNLTAASQVVFTEADWNPAACVQAEDRAHRIGQVGSSVTVQYLVIEGTLDARIVQVMAQKMDVADRALDRVTDKPELPAMPVAVAKPVLELPKPTTSQSVTIGKYGKTETYNITEDKVKAACEALSYLAGNCDGCRTKDDAGFNGKDARSDFVRSLVQTAQSGRMSPKQTAWALKILNTYKNTQLTHLADRLYG